MGRDAAHRKSSSVYEDRYRVINGQRAEYWQMCVYCGRPAATRDHVPPISRINDYDSLGMKTPMYLKVPACIECNTIGADTLQESFIERTEFIKDKLARKYARALSVPDWEEDEIQQLGKNLQSKVRAALARRAPQLERIEYYGGIDAVLDQLLDIYGEAPFDAR